MTGQPLTPTGEWQLGYGLEVPIGFQTMHPLNDWLISAIGVKRASASNLNFLRSLVRGSLGVCSSPYSSGPTDAQ